MFTDNYVNLSDNDVDLSDNFDVICMTLTGDIMWQVNIKIWQVNIKIWQVDIIIWQVMAEICHHNYLPLEKAKWITGKSPLPKHALFVPNLIETGPVVLERWKYEKFIEKWTNGWRTTGDLKSSGGPKQKHPYLIEIQNCYRIEGPCSFRKDKG